jgi:protein-tyrosine phosphatase
MATCTVPVEPGDRPAADRYHPLIAVLFVCTGNLHRSPMAAVLFELRVRERGCALEVGSAGFAAAGQPAPASVVSAVAERGADLADHRSRVVDAGMIAGSELVVGMTRQHLVELAACTGERWTRCFTLAEIVERGRATGPRRAGETLAAWVARAHHGRTRPGVLGLRLSDDVEDPIGMRPAGVRRVRDRIDGLVGELAVLVCPA